MKISIITVVYNSVDHVQNCIESVLQQDIPQLEYIIVDGGSKDGTQDVIQKYRDKLSHFVSEPDSGIYDAMNKGIRMATGDIIGILNADDFYTHSKVLSTVAAAFDNQTIDSLYADVEYVKREDVSQIVRRWISGAFSKNKFYYGWSPPHPTFFVRKNIFQKYGLYNQTLKISADYEMMLRLLFVKGVKTFYLAEVIIKMREGGISNKTWRSRVQANREDLLAWKINDISPKPYTLSLKPLRKLRQFL